MAWQRPLDTKLRTVHMLWWRTLGTGLNEAHLHVLSEDPGYCAEDHHRVLAELVS